MPSPREPAERWVRFHSLPGAKRYADTDAERAEILRRHLAVLDRLNPAGEALLGVEGDLEGFLRSVAEEERWNVTIADAAGEWRYHPYDGGADVIARTVEQRDALATEFAAWLSPRDDGL
jgi:hypothetical protein